MSRPPRGSNRPTIDDAPDSTPSPNAEEEGELGDLKRKYSSKLSTIKEMFPDWTDEDIVFALQETEGNLEATIDRISEGTTIRSCHVDFKAKNMSFLQATSRSGEKSRKRPRSVPSRNQKMLRRLRQTQPRPLLAVDEEEVALKGRVVADVVRREDEVQVVVGGVFPQSMDLGRQDKTKVLWIVGPSGTGVALLRLTVPLALQIQPQMPTGQLWIHHGNISMHQRQPLLQDPSLQSPA